MNDARLAIDGGPPTIPEGPPRWPGKLLDVERVVRAALRDGSWGEYHAHWLDDLVDSLAQFLQVSHVWPCASGTIGVELALRGLGVAERDEVLLAGYDFPGNFRAIEAVGASPALFDVEPQGWIGDIRQLEAAKRPACRVAIVSHLHGQLIGMPKLMALARSSGLLIVEDACQVPGAIIAGRRAGTWGDAGVFSFGGSKLLTAGRGGAVVTNDPQIYQRLKICSERGNHAYPLSQLQAAALLPQVPALDRLNARRREGARHLARHILELEHVGLLTSRFLQLAKQQESGESAVYGESALYKVPFLIDPQLASRRGDFLAAVQAEGVAMDIGFRGFVHRSSRRCRREGELQHSRAAAERTLLLHHPILLQPESQIERAAQAVQKVCRFFVDQSPE